MFRDLIESILIFLDGREKLVAQIVLYVFLLGGGSYFLFFYEGKEKIIEGVINQVMTSSGTQEVTDIAPDTQNSIPLDTPVIPPGNITGNDSGNQNNTNTQVSYPAQSSEKTGFIAKIVNEVKQVFTPENPNKVEIKIEEEKKEEVKIEEPQILELEKEVIVPEQEIPKDEVIVDNINQNQILQNNSTATVSTTQTNTVNNSSEQSNINQTQNTVSNTNSGTEVPAGNQTTNNTDTSSINQSGSVSNTIESTTNETSTTENTNIGTNGAGETSSGSITEENQNTGGGNTDVGGTGIEGNSGIDQIDPEEETVEDYFDNEVSVNTGNGYKGIKITVSSEISPNYPIPSDCMAGYSPMGVYSNITSLITLFIPHNDMYGNTMSIINEYEVLANGMKKLYKVFNVNGVKNGAVLYKTVNPNVDYHWSFTVCLED